MPKCSNCTVHNGFMTSWRNTRCIILPHIEKALALYPDYRVTLVGHSLGGAVAALASLEFKARGWEPQVTTFGEPRVGNQALVSFIDAQFNLTDQESPSDTYRRVTHVNDPVPLLPLEEWGYRMHAGEIFISKSSLSPSRADLQHCTGDEDSKCIAGGTSSNAQKVGNATRQRAQDWQPQEHEMWWLPPRFRLWQLFFAHRDYFWRLGLCVPGGDPSDWWREKYPHKDVPDEL
jgi:pimeloyl-ACP methyl ester carboxylesterase